MITKNYLGGRIALMRGEVNLVGSNILAALVRQGSTFMTDTMVLHMNDFTALHEFSGAARQALTSYLLTPDWDRDRVIFSTDNPTWTALANDVGGPIVGVILLQQTGIEADNIPLYAYQLSTPVNPGGSDYTFELPADGISEI